MTSLFSKINNWNDFNSALIPLNKKEKGDAFELLSKLYFLIDHKYDNYDNIWLLSDVPKKELEIISKKDFFISYNKLILWAKIRQTKIKKILNTLLISFLGFYV